jgi:hypothetical protein
VGIIITIVITIAIIAIITIHITIITTPLLPPPSCRGGLPLTRAIAPHRLRQHTPSVRQRRPLQLHGLAWGPAATATATAAPAAGRQAGRQVARLFGQAVCRPAGGG